jgi:flavodoxin
MKEELNMKKVLIAYFSHSGNTKVVANCIKENVGGDIFEIKTVETYPAEYDAVVAKAKKEQDADQRPKLAAKVQNMDAYDVVFVGYPMWWYTLPMAVVAFLGTYDLAGKTIVPFCTHEGSGLSKSAEDIKKLCPKSKVLDGLAIRGGGVNKAQNEVAAWVRKLGIAGSSTPLGRSG